MLASAKEEVLSYQFLLYFSGCCSSLSATKPRLIRGSDFGEADRPKWVFCFTFGTADFSVCSLLFCLSQCHRILGCGLNALLGESFLVTFLLHHTWIRSTSYF